MKKYIGIVSVLFLLGCDGLNASFKKNGGGGTGGDTTTVIGKPGECKFDFAKTCWAETIERATRCLNPTQAPEVLSQTKEFCTSTDGKLIAFANPQTMFATPFDPNHTPIDFRVFPDSVHECMHVKGTPQKFTITLTATKETIDYDFTTDNMRFSCLDGQTVHIPYDVFSGCAQLGGDKFITTVPGIEMRQAGSTWVFRFRGSPQSPNIFACQE